ncbi:SAM-dependent methyltransferase [Actinoplanes sp. NEAU-A12]|uniref:SAM-dependent methyltransferase n=2 Tax=Actinoplanes sandaracinus TaxID=3045177 RepID=A0ABT6WSD4_9ACTN|nr:SAM-dependent methyltransferase [Actinoplanes sandaracinus]
MEETAPTGPGTRLPARENRAFLQRAVRFMAVEARIGQFLDIGAGRFTAGNTHDVAQRRVPQCRVVYAGTEPAADAHARALLTSSPEGATGYIEGDLRQPREILGHPRFTEIIDLDRPVGLILIPVPHVVPGHAQARDNVRELLAALPSGSYLAASSFTLDYNSPQQVAIARQTIARDQPEAHPRSRAEFAEFFTGLGLIGPGIVPVSEWLPEVPAHQRPSPEQIALLGAVGRKL